jgi:BolA protein
MTITATAPLVEIIADRLTSALAPSHLAVSNDSAQHRGHMGDDGTGESHFSVTIESPAFAGQSRVARQRMVNAALADLLASRIHALAIKARAPGEETKGFG